VAAISAAAVVPLFMAAVVAVMSAALLAAFPLELITALHIIGLRNLAPQDACRSYPRKQYEFSQALFHFRPPDVYFVS
jgi:choline-glycine betaine transporter